MKKTFWIIASLMLLYSCGTDEQDVVITGLKVAESKEFSISIPEKWNVIDDYSNLPSPQRWQLSFAANASDLKYGFVNNILVLSQDLGKIVSSKDFSILNNVGSSKEYLSYTRLDTLDLTFDDGDITSAYIFEAKYNTHTPVLKFVQFGKVCGITRGHLVTIAVSQDTKNIDPYVEFAKTFSCKK